MANARKIPYEGKMTPYPEVAKALGLTSLSMRKRVLRYVAGEIDEQELLKPKLGKKAEEPQEKGTRAEAMAVFLDSFNEHIKPKLKEEMKEFAETGVEGPCLALYHKYKDYLIVKEKGTAEDNSPKAKTAIIFVGGEPPKDYTIL